MTSFRNILRNAGLRTFVLLLAIATATVSNSFSCLAAEPGDTEPTRPIRPVRTSYTFDFGAARLADTYLTPLHYDGWHLGFNYEHFQAMRFSPEKWSMQLRIGLGFDRTQNPARNATMLDIMLNASWGMLRKYKVMDNLTLAIGPELGANVGCLYLSRNGNNPASAKAAITLNATGLAAYKLKVGKLPMTITYQPTLACLGAFFSPDYGQLYYQIYVGERSGLAHCAWWGNYFSMDNRLSVDLHLGATALRLGYHGNLLSTKVNNLVTHAFTHAFSLGVTLDWFAFRPGQINNCISAY